MLNMLLNLKLLRLMHRLISLPSSVSIASVIEECRLATVVAKIAIGVFRSVPAAGI